MVVQVRASWTTFHIVADDWRLLACVQDFLHLHTNVLKCLGS